MKQLVVGFFQFSGALFHHLLQTTGDFFLFLFVFGNITTDLNKFGDPAILFPNRIDVDFEIARIPPGFVARHNLPCMSFGADDFFQRANNFTLLTTIAALLKDLVAFPPNHFFT